MIRRDVYEAIGGHRAVCGEVLEDVALARRAKQAGYALYFAPGQGITRVRMYRTFAAMWQGWTKNLYPLFGGSARRLMRELVTVIPWIAVALLLLGRLHRALPVLGLLLLAGRHAAYAAVLRRNRFPISRILYYIPGVFLYASALLVSAWRHTRGTVIWRGREYSVGRPEGSSIQRQRTWYKR